MAYLTGTVAFRTAGGLATGLGTNALVNLMVLTGLLLYVVEMPPELVFGRILPAVGFMLFPGNLYYAFMARRLGVKTGRTDVTALPSGPSVPHMFIVVLVIMMPIICCWISLSLCTPSWSTRWAPPLNRCRPPRCLPLRPWIFN